MSNSTDRDWEYGVKPRNILPPKQEGLPYTPAKKPSGYCKRLKGEHVFTLAEVKVYPHHHWIHTEVLVTGVSNWKEYRCEGCNKKKIEREVFQFDEPVKANTLHRGMI